VLDLFSNPLLCFVVREHLLALQSSLRHGGTREGTGLSSLQKKRIAEQRALAMERKRAKLARSSE
jgi:hypothetical protein